jgi:putative ABC transport system ATP-binding protein
MSAADRHKLVEIALDAVSLRDRANHYPRQLSGGQEQRVGIARAIVANPTIIVADEPTGDLDAVTTEQILDLIQRLNSELGMTLLVVTHDPRVAALAPRQLRLEKGKLIEKGREVSVVGAEPRERRA